MNVSGKIIVGTITGSGKKYRIKLTTKYGTMTVPFVADAKDKEKTASKLIMEIIPKSEYVGMINNMAIFTSPAGWKGGVNA